MDFVPAGDYPSEERAGRPATAGSPANKIWIATETVAALIFLTLAVGTALTLRPNTDEGLFADPAYTLATKGYMGSPALRDNLHLLRIAQHTYWIFPLDPVMVAAWYRIFGAGLFSMRILSICFGLLGLGAIFIFIQELSRDTKIAALAAAMTALDYFYIYGSSSGRMDIICAALGYAGLAAYMALRERNLALALLVSHSLVVASGMTHPNGFLYFMGLLFVMVYFDHRRLNWQQLVLAAVPYFVSAGLWGLYISQDPQAFLAQIRANARDADRFQGLRHPLLAIVREITVRYGTAYGFGSHSFGHAGPIFLKALALLAYGAGIIAALSIPALRRKTEVRVLLAIIGLYFLYLSIFDGQKAYYYLVHFIPMYAALLALFIFWLLADRKLKPIIVLLPLSFIALVQLAGLAYRIRLNSYKNEYIPAVRYLQHQGRKAQLINADINFVFGLEFPDNLIDDSHLNETADFFVIDSDVAERLKNSRTRNPAVYRHVTGLLANCYKKVYDQNAIAIYQLQKTRAGICIQANEEVKWGNVSE